MALLRKEKKMSNNARGANVSDLRDRVLVLERELKRTQNLVRDDIKKLYELVQRTARKGL